MNIIESNPIAIDNFLKSNDNSKANWEFLLSELISENSTVILDTITQINRALEQNFKIDLILDICDFILEYGNNYVLSTFLICLNNIYYLDSNKGVYVDESIAQKKLFLLQKWANKYGKVYPPFQEKYNEIKSKGIIFPSVYSKIETYSEYISEEEILKLKSICEHQKNMNKNLRETWFNHAQMNQNNEKKKQEELVNSKKEKDEKYKNQIKIQAHMTFPTKNIIPCQNETVGNPDIRNLDNNGEQEGDNANYYEGMTPYGDPIPSQIGFNIGPNMDPNQGGCELNLTPENKDNNKSRKNAIVESSNMSQNKENQNYKYIKSKNSDKKDNDINKEDKKPKFDKIFTNDGNKDNNNSQRLDCGGCGENNNTLMNFGLDDIYKYSNKDLNENMSTNESNFINNNSNNLKRDKNLQKEEYIKNIINNNVSTGNDFTLEHNINNNINKGNYKYNNKNMKNPNNPKNNNNFNKNFNNSKGNINNPDNIPLGSKYMRNSNNSFNSNNNVNYKNNNINNNINIHSNNNINNNKCYNNININRGINYNKFPDAYNKYLPNYNVKNSYLRLMDLNLFKRKIEKEIKKLNSWINQGFISFYNTYTCNLKIGIENIKKEILLCDKLIEFNTGVNNFENVKIVKNIKNSILELISKYDKFMGENFEKNILLRSCFDKNQNISNYEKNRNSVL